MRISNSAGTAAAVLLLSAMWKVFLQLQVALPLLVFGEMLAPVVILSLLFGGILAIGLTVGHHVSYALATVPAIGWAVLVLKLRDRWEKWVG